jgi:hypothetical protein
MVMPSSLVVAELALCRPVRESGTLLDYCKALFVTDGWDGTLQKASTKPMQAVKPGSFLFSKDW